MQYTKYIHSYLIIFDYSRIFPFIFFIFLEKTNLGKLFILSAKPSSEVFDEQAIAKAS